MLVQKAYRLKLYPTKAQAESMARCAGSCRWLWNHLLALQKSTYEAEQKFIFRFEMQKLLPGLKSKHEWLKETPVHSLQRACRNLDLALKSSFRNGGGFPRFKQRGKARESFYVSNGTLRIDGGKVVLPKIAAVKFRSGRLPIGKIMSGTVSFDGSSWWCTVQCAEEVDIPALPLDERTAVGIDLGLNHLIIASDGTKIAATRHLRKAEKRLRRAQRVLASRQRRSANRRRQVKIVQRLHRRVADCRRDTIHKATSQLVASSSAIFTEDPNVSGMMKNRHLAKSFVDAGWGEVLRQIAYKAEWAGKAHHRIGRFGASSQTCSACNARKTGDQKLKLHNRIFRCAECNHVQDRDENAAENIRRMGLKLIVNNVGQAMPERAVSSADACGDASAGRVASTRRHVSPKQEPHQRINLG